MDRKHITKADILIAIRQYLELGMATKGGAHQGYFSEGGRAYEVLNEAAKILEQEIEEATNESRKTEPK